MSDPQCKQCGGTIHPYECGSDGCCGECNYHAALTSSASMAERAAIVVWLRSWADRNGEVDVSGEIERGEHIKNPDESSHVPTTGKEGFNDE